MNVAQSSTWIIFGLMFAMSAVYAQELGQRSPQRSITPDKAPAVTTAFQQLLLDADALVKSGRPAEAYELLEPFEFEHAGETRFDYLIGIAALDSGKPDRATLAFERVLAVDPDFAAARVDIARAYFQLGDLPRARTEFLSALKQDPSEKARFTIQKYLDEIASRESGNNTRMTGYIEGTIGHDSNVNNSTGQADIFVDVIGAIRTLDPANVKASDNYIGIAAGGEVNHSLSPRSGLFAGADLRQRINGTQKEFDTRELSASVGLMFGMESNRLRASALAGQHNLGDSHNHDISGLNADWRYSFSPSNHVRVFGQYAQYRYAEPAMQVNDFNLQSMGLGWMHVLANGKLTLSGSLYQGTEKDVSTTITPSTPNGGRVDGEKRFSGFRAGGQALIGDKSTIFISAGGQIGDYSKINPLFLRQRSDRFYDLTVGAVWHWDKLLTLRPRLNYSKNRSNIEIYDYDRMDISVTVRRDFR